MNEKQISILLTGGVLALALVYIASESAGHAPTSRQLGGEIQFSGLFNVGSEGKGSVLDIDPGIHGWHPGYDPVNGRQRVARSKQRYPRHCGQNFTAVITHGFNPLAFLAPDDSWAAQPPSEVSL